MVRRDSAERILECLLDALGDLDRYRERVELDQLLRDRDTRNMVYHAMYIATQATIDLAFHLAASEGLAQPATYQNVFTQLAESGVLDRELARRLAGWAGLRNVLAHLYPVVCDHKVYRALTDETDDLRSFAALIIRVLEQGD